MKSHTNDANDDWAEVKQYTGAVQMTLLLSLVSLLSPPTVLYQ
jgi:hypothetical protein